MSLIWMCHLLLLSEYTTHCLSALAEYSSRKDSLYTATHNVCAVWFTKYAPTHSQIKYLPTIKRHIYSVQHVM